MKIIQSKHIEGELLEVDNTHFIDCTLVRCLLQYGGGQVVMERTRIIGCHHVFAGPARMTVNYLEAMDLLPPNHSAPRGSGNIVH